ncbi:hypothetical protein BDW62DRAFT_138943 [Aspergillus aurantiobrunneus]
MIASLSGLLAFHLPARLGKPGSFGMGPRALRFGSPNHAVIRGAVVSCRSVYRDCELLDEQARDVVESTGCSGHGQPCPPELPSSGW